jgi:hypothetical protein
VGTRWPVARGCQGTAASPDLQVTVDTMAQVAKAAACQAAQQVHTLAARRVVQQAHTRAVHRVLGRQATLAAATVAGRGAMPEVRTARAGPQAMADQAQPDPPVYSGPLQAPKVTPAASQAPQARPATAPEAHTRAARPACHPTSQ